MSVRKLAYGSRHSFQKTIWSALALTVALTVASLSAQGASVFEDFILPEDHTMLYISYAVLAGAVIAAGIFFVHVFRDRKQSRQFRKKFIARKKKLLNEVMESGEERETAGQEESTSRN